MPTVRANGIELHYETMGQGEPLVLIMGLGAQLVYWDERFCQQLADRGFQVIRFDNRDVGLSSKIDHHHVPNVRRAIARAFLGLRVEAPYTLLDMADDTAGLLDALGIGRAHLLGVSMGGMIAQTFAILHPHRLASLTSVMSSPGDRLSGTGKPRAIKALLRPPARSRDEAVQRQVELFRIIGSQGLGVDEDRLRQRAALAYDRCFYPRGVARQIAAIMASGSRTGALRFVRAPTLVIHGTHDPLIPSAGGRRTAKAIPGAELLMVPGMGHDLPPGSWRGIAERVARLARRAPIEPARATTAASAGFRPDKKAPPM